MGNAFACHLLLSDTFNDDGSVNFFLYRKWMTNILEVGHKMRQTNNHENAERGTGALCGDVDYEYYVKVLMTLSDQQQSKRNIDQSDSLFYKWKESHGAILKD